MQNKTLELVVEDFLKAHLKKESLCVALSGGADSMVLLYLTRKFAVKEKLHLSALHVHHGIRGEAADQDEQFCRTQCSLCNIPLDVFHVDVPSYADKEHLSTETAARELRYECFSQYREKHPETILLTAHNETDQIETMLFRMLRGTSTDGLCGIQEQRGWILRPLLTVSSEEIRSFALSENIPFVVDETNLNDEYARNSIRHRLLPLLNELNPSFATQLIKLRSSASKDYSYFQKEVQSWIQAHKFDRDTFRTLHPALAYRVLRTLYEEVRISRDALTNEQLENCYRFLLSDTANGTIVLPKNIELFCEPHRFAFRKKEESKEQIEFHIPLKLGINELPHQKGILYLASPNEEIHLPNAFQYHSKAIVTTSSLDSLFARNRINGDSYHANGMTRTIKKLMNAMKISVLERNEYPIVCDNLGILWLPGYAPRDIPACKDQTIAIYYYLRLENL